jgi:excisionase family DNA binding protein
MEPDITLKTFLQEILEPIINDCISRSMNKYIHVLKPDPSEKSDVMDIAQAAEYLKVSKATIYGYVHDQRIPNYITGKMLYFRKVDLDQWINRSRRKSNDEITAEATAYLSKRGYK